MRTAFIENLIFWARSHPEIFLIVGDLGYSVVEPFAREFPNRFLNAGIAEQNMAGLAAGLAAEGYHPFIYSIANFPTFRCAEQIRNDIAYHKLPVTIVAVGGGVAYGSLGYSHHAVQDYAVMRTFPGMLIASPGDPLETKACLKHLVENPGPSYLRLGKAGELSFHTSEPEVAPGKLVSVVEATDDIAGVLLTSGSVMNLALKTTEKLSNRWSVYTLPLWSEAVKPLVQAQIRKFKNIITIEEHLYAGGFGSYVREAAGNETPLQQRIYCHALTDSVCGMVGSQSYLKQQSGLNIENLVVLANQCVDTARY